MDWRAAEFLGMRGLSGAFMSILRWLLLKVPSEARSSMPAVVGIPSPGPMIREYEDLGAIHGYHDCDADDGLAEIAERCKSQDKEAPAPTSEAPLSSEEVEELVKPLETFRESYLERYRFADAQTRYLHEYFVTPNTARFLIWLGALSVTSLGFVLGSMLEPLLLSASNQITPGSPAPVQDLVSLFVVSFRDLHDSLNSTFPPLSGLDWLWTATGLLFVLAAVIFHMLGGNAQESLNLPDLLRTQNEVVPRLQERVRRGGEVPDSSPPGQSRRHVVVFVLILTGMAMLLSSRKSEYLVSAAILGSALAFGFTGIAVVLVQIYLRRLTSDNASRSPRWVEYMLVSVPVIMLLGLLSAYVLNAGNLRTGAIQAATYGSVAVMLYAGSLLFGLGRCAATAFTNWNWWQAKLMGLEGAIAATRHPSPVQSRPVQETEDDALPSEAELRAAYLRGHHIGALARRRDLSDPDTDRGSSETDGDRRPVTPPASGTQEVMV